MGTDARMMKAEIVSALREMERIHGCFRFGVVISERVLQRTRSLLAAIADAKGNFSGRPSDQRIHSAIVSAAAAYHEFERMDDMAWIEHHELIHARLSQLLSTSKARRYSTTHAEMQEWRLDVFTFTKAVATKLKRKRKRAPEEFQRNIQICINVVHSLMSLLRDNSKDALFQKDCSFLVNLCQTARILPSSFLSPDKLQMAGDPVDAGASATVYRGFLGKTEVAVKDLRMYFRTVNLVKKRFIREALILQAARHPNVLRFLSIVDEPFKICIITPWYPRGHIMKYLASTTNVQLKELMEQVADGLHFLSQYGIVHGDLKGVNILIDDDGKAVIADFKLGLSFIQDENLVEQPSHVVADPFALAIARARCARAIKTGGLSLSPKSISALAGTILSAAVSSTGGGTFRWMAPERLVPSAYDLPTAKATMKSDVYSFGMLMLEVFSGAPPWGSRPEGAISLSVITNMRPPRPRNIPDELWQIAQECWSHFPRERPTILDVYNRLACIP
ncbi:kinase-like domain-containing protein [Mycena crocata]|nr:kinase-like domain-containing protein [Mycena crocata]